MSQTVVSLGTRETFPEVGHLVALHPEADSFCATSRSLTRSVSLIAASLASSSSSATDLVQKELELKPSSRSFPENAICRWQ